MALLRYLARTLGWDPQLRDSLALASQDGQGVAAQVDSARKMDKEVDHLLAKLKRAGKEIDDETARIIDEEIARIKADATRKARRNKGIRWWHLLLGITASCAATYCLGVELFERAIIKELTEGSHGGLGFYMMLNALVPKGAKGGVQKN